MACRPLSSSFLELTFLAPPPPLSPSLFLANTVQIRDPPVFSAMRCGKINPLRIASV